MEYECLSCGTVREISNGAAWPEQCDSCGVWSPGWRSPAYSFMLDARPSANALGHQGFPTLTSPV